MEYADGGELVDLVHEHNGLDEERARDIIR